MVIFFSILLVILGAVHVAAKIFAAVPYLAALVQPSLWACVGCAVLLLLFVVIRVITEIKGNKK